MPSLILPMLIPNGRVVCIRCQAVVPRERAVTVEKRPATMPDGREVETDLWWCVHCIG